MYQVIFIIIYWCCEAVTESATTLYRHKGVNAFDSGTYHFYRLLEAFAIIMIALTHSTLLELIGGWMMGYYGYMLVMAAMLDRSIASPYPYTILSYSFTIKPVWVHLVGFSGLLLLILGVII